MESRRLWKSARRRARALPPAAVEELMRRLQRDATRIAAHFDLTYRAILPERPSVRGHYGICYEDGLIKIRLEHATHGTALKYSSLISTLCHELAHLRFFHHTLQPPNRLERCGRVCCVERHVRELNPGKP